MIFLHFNCENFHEPVDRFVHSITIDMNSLDKYKHGGKIVFMKPKTIIQKELTKMSQQFWDGIPMKEIADLIKANGGLMVQEDGTEWQGIICGASSYDTFQVTGIKTSGLRLSWYRMASGRYEITAYLM